MIKFLDLVGLTALWNKIKSTFYTKTLIDNIVDKKVDDYSKHYLTIVSLEDNNTIGWQASNANLLKTISVSTDLGKTWTEKTSSTAGTSLATLNTGDELWVKGSNSAYGTFSTALYYNKFTSLKNFNIEGNIISLLYEDNFIGLTALTIEATFIGLFYLCKIISAKNLILPSTTLTSRCYYMMFISCTSLTEAPELPATTLADSCYDSMFSNCTSLTIAPELPATTLAQSCYSHMFGSCMSLITAPELPAIVLAQSCYSSMFGSCKSLTTAPELPAATLAERCYNSMFVGCTLLNYIKCLATNISASYCTTNWVNNIAASGTFIKSNDSTPSWSTGISGIPSGWTVYNDYTTTSKATSISGSGNNTTYPTTRAVYNAILSVKIPIIDLTESD